MCVSGCMMKQECVAVPSSGYKCPVTFCSEIVCVRVCMNVCRFKDCLNDEKEALVLQVNRLQEELLDLRKNSKTEKISGQDMQPKMHCSR